MSSWIIINYLNYYSAIRHYITTCTKFLIGFWQFLTSFFDNLLRACFNWPNESNIHERKVPYHKRKTWKLHPSLFVRFNWPWTSSQKSFKTNQKLVQVITKRMFSKSNQYRISQSSWKSLEVRRLLSLEIIDHKKEGDPSFSLKSYTFLQGTQKCGSWNCPR